MTEDESKRYPVSGEISLTFTSVKNENSEKVNGKKSPSKAVNENDSNLEVMNFFIVVFCPKVSEHYSVTVEL